MMVPEIRAKLCAGGRIYGTLVVSPSPHWPVHLAGAGLDFVFIDTEHIALDRGTVSWMCRAYAAAGIAPIVRVPSPDPFAASGMLDGGAAGIIAPYIETVEQVQLMRGAVKLAPLKGERLARILSGAERPEPELAEYLGARARERLLLVNIESLPAIENLDAILAVPDLDGIVVGPHDLSCSLGAPEDYTSPAFSAVLREILEKTRRRGLIAGIHFMSCGPTELAVEWLRWGANLLIQHADVVYAVRGLAAELGAIRAAFGDKPAGEAGRINV
ncbi:MAG TPA: aldolase/citrate lyase family protein [Planctomycetota bacterium]|nr:aldolase/citrate lyase family protein [Planctomycetota bacterium]